MKKLTSLMRGQVISILIAGTGVFASLLSSTTPSSNHPVLMAMFNYMLLSSYLVKDTVIEQLKKICSNTNDTNTNKSDDNDTNTTTTTVTINSDIESTNNESLLESSTNATNTNGTTTTTTTTTNTTKLWYLLAAFIDVEANYLVIRAYNYTTITSIMLLDCFTIPSAMFLSYWFLGYGYTMKHFIGIIICLLGLSCIIVSDATQNNDNDAPNIIFGDVMCLLGSFIYAVSNVLQEYLVKDFKRDHYLGYLGLFGTIIALIQFIILDYNILTSISSSLSLIVIIYIIGFTLCMFLMYTNTSLFLQDLDSTLFNLSLLTSDIYAVIFSYFVYHTIVHWLYYIAFVLVVVGLLLYYNEVSPQQIKKNDNNNDNNDNGNKIYNPLTAVDD